MAMTKEEEYAQIEEVVNRYKGGDNEAGLEILALCKGFTDKFKNAICYGKSDLSNRSIRAFISMFIPRNATSIKLSSYKRSHNAVRIAEDTAITIMKAFYMYEPDEIDNIIAVVLLALAKKYRNLNGMNTFYAYITSCFHYRLYEQLKILLDDTVNLAYYRGNNYHENLIENATYDNYDLNDLGFARNKLIVYEESDEVGDNWLLGYDNELLKQLSPVEKKILMYKFVHKLSDEEIGEHLGCSRHTILRRRTKLLANLEEYARQKGLLKG